MGMHILSSFEGFINNLSTNQIAVLPPGTPYIRHLCEAFYHSVVEMAGTQCPCCSKLFSHKDSCQRHQKICKFRGSQPPEKRPRLNQQQHQTQRLPQIHGYCCRQCGCYCATRRLLHYHRNHQHGGGGLQQAPWSDALWDPALKEVIEGNSSIILAPERVDRGRHMLYNIPTDGLREGMDMIIDRMRNIYDQHTTAFKVNVYIGFILRHVETEEYRYFAPNRNQPMWNLPYLVSNRQSLTILENRLREMNVLEYLQTSKPNSQWKPFLVTNFVFDVTPTKFPLGYGDLPDYVVNCKGLVTLHKNTKGQLYQDNLCFFRCLSHPEMGKVKEALRQWEQYMGEVIPVSLQVMPDLEQCFKKNIYIYELQENGTVVPVYESFGHFEEDLRLNLRYNNHLSLITDFSRYAKKYSCQHCQKLFDHRGDWRHHQKSCIGVTKATICGRHVHTAMQFF